MVTVMVLFIEISAHGHGHARIKLKLKSDLNFEKIVYTVQYVGKEKRQVRKIKKEVESKPLKDYNYEEEIKMFLRKKKLLGKVSKKCLNKGHIL